MESQQPDDVSLEQIAEEFIQRHRGGERPQVSEYVQRHPEHADEIRELFPALVMMERIAPEDSQSQPDDAALPEAAPAHVQQLGDYRILREIGRGGMGIVYEAEQVSLGRHVALKVLTTQMQKDSQQRKRFEREARAAAKLHHTNIVPVFGVGEDGGTCYYVMQFIHGLGLDEVIEELRRMVREHGPLSAGPQVVERPIETRDDVSAVAIAQSLVTGEFRPLDKSQAGEENVRGPLTVAAAPTEIGARSPLSGILAPSDASSSSSPSMVLPSQGKDSSGGRAPTYWHSVANIGLQVAEALHHAHELGVLHRDVKPSNLLLDVQGNVWVTDFGLAKLDDEQNLTHTGDVLGTLRYMAPELFSGIADARSEVYSLGLTLYELLALKPAYDETDRNKLIRQVTFCEPPQLRKAAPAVPRDLATICQKCIETDPARRYQSAETMADDLRRWLNGEPIQARPIGGFERVARWCKRHPAVAGLLAAVVVVTLLGFAGVLWQWRDAERERQDAVNARNTADEQRDKARWLAYKASITAASAALESDNPVLAEQALQNAPAEHRGWEWRHFANQLKTSATALQGGQEWSRSVYPGGMAINANGTALAACQPDGSIRIWALPEGTLIKVLPRQDKGFLSVYFSPDGARLVGHSNDTLTLWNVKTGERLAFWKGKQEALNSGIHFSLDGSILAYLRHRESTIHRWDCRTGKRLPDVEAEASILMGNVEFASTGDNLFVPCRERSQAYVLDVKSGKRRNLVTTARETYSFNSLAVSPDQTKLAVGGYWPDNSVSVWDVQSGTRLWKATGHKNSVYKVLFSPDGSQVASVCRDQTIRLLDLSSGRSIAVLRGHTRLINNVTFSPDGAQIFTCSEDKTIRVWDAQTGGSLFVLRGHEKSVHNVIVLPGGQMLVSQGRRGKVLFWNLEFLQRNLLRGHTNFVYDAIFSPDASRIVSIGWDNTIRTWDVATGRRRAVLDNLPSHAISAAIHPDGGHVAAVLGLNKGIVL